MKASVLQKDFRAAIELARLGRASKSSLPVLMDVRLETVDGHMEVSGTDLETCVVASCGAKVETDGGVYANGVGLRAAVKGMKGCIALGVTPQGLLVSDGRVSAVVATLPLSEGPNKPTVEGVTLLFDDLPGALSRVVHAAAVKGERPVLESVLVEAKDGWANVVACDSFQMAVEKIACEGEGSVIIPIRTVKALIKAQVYNLTIGDKFVWGDGDAQVYAQIIPGMYPQWQQIVRSQSRVNVIVDGWELRAALKGFVPLKPCVTRVNVQMDGLILSAEGVTANVSGVSDGAMEIGVNHRYLADACMDGPVTLGFNSPDMPIILEQGDHTNLVMPMHIAK